MACYSVTKYGFLTVADIMSDIVDEMTNTNERNTSTLYFTKVFGDETFNADGVVILESTTAVDPLAEVVTNGATVSRINGAWRICFKKLDANRVAVLAATALQFTDSGDIAYVNNRAYTGVPVKKQPAGNLGEDWTGTGGLPGTTTINQVWLDRRPDIGSNGAYPMSYTLTMTNRGIFLGIWEDSQEEIPQSAPDDVSGNSPFRWFLIQRPVDRTTGHVRGGPSTANTSRCPVYCISGTGSPADYRKFVVREADVVSPSKKKYATVPSNDSTALINPYPQQSLTESGEFVVTFINNLTTSRYRYSDELDMLGTVSAEVIGTGTTIDVTVYDEPEPRTYTALYANKEFGTGMRLMVLTSCSSAVEDSHLV